MRRRGRTLPVLSVMFLLMLPHMLVAGSALASPASQGMIPCNGTALVNVRMVVSATESWQETYVPVDKLRGVEYLDGSWTVNRRNVSSTDPLADANGYDRMAGPDHGLPGERDGGLIGRASETRDHFWVGNVFYGAPYGNGSLQLAVNDVLDAGGLGDNAGAVNVLVWYCQ